MRIRGGALIRGTLRVLLECSYCSRNWPEESNTVHTDRTIQLGSDITAVWARLMFASETEKLKPPYDFIIFFICLQNNEACTVYSVHVCAGLGFADSLYKN
jgi:hypothetical protein